MAPASIQLIEDRPEHDVVIIGGGVLGTGVARDCALRGMKVALFEKHDWGFGASGSSSGMIHGSARYLTDQPRVTQRSCRESGYIQQIAPHLVFRIPFLFPIPARGFAARIALAAADAFFAFYDRYQPLKRSKPHTILRPDEVRALEPGLGGDIRGAISFDEWGVDGARLCLANVLDAIEHGARCHAYHEVVAILRDPPEKGGAARGVVARDRETGRRVLATARRVVNATGAWSPITAGLADSAAVRVRPGKGIHVVFDRRIGNYGVLCRAIDGRRIFAMPWQNLSVLGTTDHEYDGDLDDVRATAAEVRYLLEGVASTLPGLSQARVIGTTAAVQATPYTWGHNAGDLSREHEIVDHGRDGVPGLYSMIGGDLASYRLFAEKMTDQLASELDVRARCRTHELPLPGGDAPVDPALLADRFRIAEPAARRLAYRHGARASDVMRRLAEDRDERAIVCPCEPVLEAEVRYAVRIEGARNVSDLARRTRLGLGPCAGMRCAHRAAQIVTQERHLPPGRAHAMAAQFLLERFRTRVVALDGVQARQEELALARYLEAGLGPAARRALAESGADVPATPPWPGRHHGSESAAPDMGFGPREGVE
jgi:glycerol-3-phosphate dehydrogenase